MTITGLENNYYLSGNDIWITISNFPKVPMRLQLKPSNLDTGVTLGTLTLYANLDNVFKFNISQIVRGLQPVPNHLTLNALQSYRFEILVTFDDNTTEATAIEKYFIRGGRDKNNIDEWFLNSNSPLVIDKWVEWRGITLPGFANKIMTNVIVDYVPSVANTYYMELPQLCNSTILKFRNSLGGYQFWVFESYEIRPKVRSKSAIQKISSRLRDDDFMNLGTDRDKQIVLKTKTPVDLQNIIFDLIESPEVMIYDPLGVDNSSKWQRLKLNSNDAVLNSYDRVYNNEITYLLPNYINRDL